MNKKIIKVDMHTHTIYSDGEYTLNEVDNIAQNNGLDVVAITDHDTMEALNYIDDSFKTKFICGVELTTNFGHMNVFGLDPKNIKVDFNSKEELENYLLEIKNMPNTFQVVNHPFSSYGLCKWELGYDYDAFEIFNSFDMWNNIMSLTMWKNMLLKGEYIPAVCGSDAHKMFYEGSQGTPCNLINCTDKSMYSIIDAIKNFENIITYFPNENIQVDYIDGGIKASNLKNIDEVRVFTEAGQVENPNYFTYEKFYIVEIWRKASYFEDYLEIKYGKSPEWVGEYDYVPIYVTNPRFK